MIDRRNYFFIHEMIYSRPGTPKELKCVGCKVAVAGACLTMATLCFYKAKQVMYNNVYSGMGIVSAGIVLGVVGAVSGRIAYDFDIYNKNLIKEKASELKTERKRWGAKAYKSDEKADRSSLQYT